MGIIDEKSLWFKGKRSVVHGYARGRETVSSRIASQSFYRMPGFAKADLINLELGAKEKLSALNIEK
jgi:hypothetical protein